VVHPCCSESMVHEYLNLSSSFFRVVQCTAHKTCSYKNTRGVFGWAYMGHLSPWNTTKGCLNVCRLLIQDSCTSLAPQKWEWNLFLMDLVAWCSLAIFGIFVVTRSCQKFIMQSINNMIQPSIAIQNNQTKRFCIVRAWPVGTCIQDISERGLLGKSIKHALEPCVWGLVAKSPRCSRSRRCELVWASEKDVHDTFRRGQRVYSFMLAINSRV
jgi:hypothetical protein